MHIKKEFVTFIPAWAVPVLCNGPDGSESEEDLALIDGFYKTLAKWAIPIQPSTSATEWKTGKRSSLLTLPLARLVMP